MPVGMYRCESTVVFDAIRVIQSEINSHRDPYKKFATFVNGILAAVAFVVVVIIVVVLLVLMLFEHKSDLVR